MVEKKIKKQIVNTLLTFFISINRFTINLYYLHLSY